MIFIVDHLEELSDIRMIQLCPNFDLILNLVEVIYHLHFSLRVVADGPLLLQAWFMHNFHSEFCDFDIVLISCIRYTFIFIFVGNRATHHTLHFTERASTDRVEYLKLIDKSLILNLFQLHFVCVVHARALFKEFLIGQGHVSCGLYDLIQVLLPAFRLLLL